MDYKYGNEIDISFKRLTADDRGIVEEFECGNPSLSDFFHHESFYSKRNVTYIFIDNLKKKVICFCSICCNGILTLKDESFTVISQKAHSVRGGMNGFFF